MAGRYKILDHLGAGGVGAVYKAYDTQLDRYVAIKRLLSKEEADRADSTTSTLKKEAASLATLQHPNIVSIYDLASDEEGLFIVMELLESDDLNVWLQRSPLDLQDFKEFASQTLEGILSAHQLNILHRDLKPENIKVARLPGGRLQAKIVDFGLARMSYAARRQSEDQSGNVVGSIFYMAPEQFIRRPLDGRTDLYSLGCVFYQALSGRRPFEAPTVRDVMNAHLEHRVSSLAEVAPAVPQPICDWVMWMINQEQIHRPANAQAALDHLRALVSAGWFNVTNTSPVPVAQRALPPSSSSTRVPTGSGTQPPRQTTATQRPVSGAYRPASGVQPLQQQATPARQPQQEAAQPKKKSAAWLYTLVALLIVGVVGWMVLPKIIFGGKKPEQKTAPPPNPNALAGIPKDLLKPGFIIHYRAGEKMDPWLDAGQPQREIKPGDTIAYWHDIERAAGDSTLSVYERRKEVAPKYQMVRVDGIKFNLGFAQFDFNDGMSHRTDKARGEVKDFPFGEKTKEKGVTIFMLLRPRLTDKEQRVFVLKNQDGGGSIYLRVFPNNEWHLHCSTRGKDGKTTDSFGKVGGRGVKGFSLVTMTWDGKTNRALLMVRSADGNKSRAEFGAPKDCPVLNELHISEYSKDPKVIIDPVDKFSGDIAQMIIWPFPMDWEPRSAQDQRLAQFYLASPGSQY